MNILFFDCESNGLPLNDKAPMWEVDNWPRVISLAFEVADAETGDLIQRSHDLVQPD